LTPLPSDSEIAKHYNNFSAGKLVRAEILEYSGLAEKSLYHQLTMIKSFGGVIGSSKRYLEVGFGGGHYLSAAENLGYKVYGVEIDYESFQKALKVGRNIYNCELKDAPFESDYFDIVKAMHVLEHSKDPAGLVKGIFRVLKPGGFLILDVPNQASIIAKIKIGLHLLGIRRNDYGYVQPPIHLYGFSPQVLRRLLCGVGFIIKRVIYTSPTDQLYFPTTPRYLGSIRGIIIKNAYKVLGHGSHVSTYAKKPNNLMQDTNLVYGH
jgi:SAM-dependent methyltransferase